MRAPVHTFLIIAVATLVAFSCSNEGNGFFAKIFGRGGGSAVPVTVENIVVSESAQTLSIPTKLLVSESVQITFPEDAVIERTYVSEGDTVDAGEPLFRLSVEEITSQLTKKRAELREAQAALDKNATLLRNRERLLYEGKIDRAQHDNLDSEVEASEAAVEKLQSDVSRLEEKSAYNTVTSPISGIVSERLASAGITIPAERPLAIITKIDPIIAEFRLASHEATTVHAGMTVKVMFPELGGESTTARITSVGSELDPKDNSFTVKANIVNPSAYFKAGMPADVEFTSSKKQRLYLIPEEALIRERHRYFVFTVIKGIAHRVQVIPNETRGNRVEIVKGLREDDLVVVKGHDKLTEGTVVDIWGK